MHWLAANIVAKPQWLDGFSLPAYPYQMNIFECPPYRASEEQEVAGQSACFYWALPDNRPPKRRYFFSHGQPKGFDEEGAPRCYLHAQLVKNSRGGLNRGIHVSLHRLICYLSFGPPPSPEYNHVMHLCQHANCLNPDHLLWGKPKENLGKMYDNALARREAWIRDTVQAQAQHVYV